MRNNSQNAGCIRRFPASHSCQPRRVQWISAAAAVCESPAASLAARISAGKGFAEVLFSPRFGWLDTAKSNLPATHPVKAIIFNWHDGFIVDLKFGDVKLFDNGFDALLTRFGGELFNEGAGFFARGFVVKDFNEGFEDFGLGHFRLQPLIPRRGGLRCATHELNYTRIACNCKSFLQKISEAARAPHNAGIEAPSRALCEGRLE